VGLWDVRERRKLMNNSINKREVVIVWLMDGFACTEKLLLAK